MMEKIFEDENDNKSFENEFGKWSKCNPGRELPV